MGGTAGSKKLFRGDDVPPPKHVTCYMSHVMCHMSRVMCHLSRVNCHRSHFFLFFIQSCEAYRWRVGYQRGLPRLVLQNKLMNYCKSNIATKNINCRFQE